jgi:hypothetical protein
MRRIYSGPKTFDKCVKNLWRYPATHVIGLTNLDWGAGYFTLAAKLQEAGSL